MAHNKLILIADDEVGIHESLRIYLSRDGYDTCSVYNGSDVMDAFTRLRPDLVGRGALRSSFLSCFGRSRSALICRSCDRCS